jgi:hypothetical protein
MLLIRCSCQVYETNCTAAELPADGGNLSTCEEHEDTRLLSRTANHLSTCEEHEHTLSKTANNCSVKIKWKCYKLAGRCNDLNSWPLAVGAADSVPTLGD